MKGKMNLPLKEFLTLVGPAQVLHIIEEGETEPAFKDRSVKIRDHEELLDREVKFIRQQIQRTPESISSRSGSIRRPHDYGKRISGKDNEPGPDQDCKGRRSSFRRLQGRLSS